jgi:hypothetical protein
VIASLQDNVFWWHSVPDSCLGAFLLGVRVCCAFLLLCFRFSSASKMHRLTRTQMGSSASESDLSKRLRGLIPFGRKKELQTDQHGKRNRLTPAQSKHDA